LGRLIRLVNGKGAHHDLRIGAVAARQHGVVTYAQLRALGVGRGEIDARSRRGALHRVHQGVYAVGHSSLSHKGRWMAAVLACGPGAVLSHASAAALWGFLRTEPGPVDVSLPSRSGRKRRIGIRIHRSRTLGPRDLSRRSEIPLTTPRRTIRDLRRTDPELARRAAREAQHTGYRVTTDRTRSDLEADFLAFCRRHRLPRPEVNVPLTDPRSERRFTADFIWRSVRLVVETDSYDYHQGDVTFEDDHARDLTLRRLGFAVLRYTGRQLEREGELVAAEIRARLGGR
jgi:putative AbiEi antitoxin of type IV toxin-antitoxin system/uncharacterized protein DUF559